MIKLFGHVYEIDGFANPPAFGIPPYQGGLSGGNFFMVKAFVVHVMKSMDCFER